MFLTLSPRLEETRSGCIPGRSSNQHGATSNLAILDHLQNDSRGLARLFLADEALRGGTGLEGCGIDAEAANVRVSRDEVETAQVLALGDGYERLGPASISIKSDLGKLSQVKSRPFATYSSHLVVFGARKPAKMFVCWGDSEELRTAVCARAAL